MMDSKPADPSDSEIPAFLGAAASLMLKEVMQPPVNPPKFRIETDSVKEAQTLLNINEWHELHHLAATLDKALTEDALAPVEVEAAFNIDSTGKYTLL